MERVVLGVLLVVALALAVGPAVAQQPASPPPAPAPSTPPMSPPDCPKLIQEIGTTTSIRFDPAAANAKEKAVHAAKLQADGKQADCVKMAQDTLASLGIKK
jgi:hypothetical protein